MAQWHPLRLALCTVMAGLLVLSPTAVAAQPVDQHQEQSFDVTRPPSLMLNVYRWATESAVSGCELPGGLLAAVAEVTSGHGQRGSTPATSDTEAGGPQLGDDGTLRPGLFGAPVGDDTDGGLWDADQILDRPVGPFQFTPATWSHYGVDTNGDGVADPQNAWDAAAAAADFLCQHGAGDPSQLGDALVIYFGGEANAKIAFDKMPAYGSLTGRNTVGEPSQLGTYWTDPTGAYLDRWSDVSNIDAATPLTIPAGPTETLWMVGDWNGDGATTPAAFEPDPDGLGLFTFFDGAAQPIGEPLRFGAPSSVPLVGDWNADGVDEVGAFVTAGNDGIFFLGTGVDTPRDAATEAVTDSGSTAAAGDTGEVTRPALVARFGQAGDLPVIGDWDGDGYDGPGVYRPSTNMFYLADQRGRPLGAPVDVAMIAVESNSVDNADQTPGSTDDADAQQAAREDAGAAFLKVINATAAGQSLSDMGVLDLINNARSGASHQRYSEQFLATLSSPTPLVADWDGNGFSDLALVRYGSDITLVERFDVHQRSMGFVELPWSLDVAAGRWEPRSTAMAGVDGSSLSGGTVSGGTASGGTASGGTVSASIVTESTDVEVHSGEEIPVARVGGILVHADIADQLAAMLDAAAADGITLTGWGWRSHQRQIELRAQNCADVWETPSSQCSPPTARPGSSRHESGKAIDFHVEGSALNRSTPEFLWLKENAADYGFFNLPSEAWHWSDTGT